MADADGRGILGAYQQLHDNPEDHEFFVKNNPQISPNSLVFEIMMAYLEESRKTRWTESV